MSGLFTCRMTLAMGYDMIPIKIVDFSEYPAGRDDRDGPDNGTRFRDEVLAPAIKNAIRTKEKVCVFLDDVKSYGSSFLDEAFGGLVRVSKIPRSDINAVLEIKANRPAYFTTKRQIEQFIREAPTSDK